MKKSELEQIIKQEIENVLEEGILSKLFGKKAKKKAKKYAGSSAAAKVISPKQFDYPDWLKKKIKDVHGKQGQGSVFSSKTIFSLADDIPKEASKQSAQILNHFATKKSPYFLKFKKPNAGYELSATKVGNRWATPGGKIIPDRTIMKVGKATKFEGPNPVEVPKVDLVFRSGGPIDLRDFKTDEITALIVPARKIVNGVPSGPPIKGKYTIITAFPGGDLPRASEWAGKYAVVTTRGAPPPMFDNTVDQISDLAAYQGMKPRGDLN